MTAPPFVAMLLRSFREEARAGATYVWRFGLVACLLLTFFFSMSTMGFVGDPGARMFEQIAWLNLVFILLAAASVYATPITEEKQEGTLGLLRMTRLGPLAILLGKSTSRLVSGISLVLAQLPFTLLAITLGGVSLQQVLATYLALIAVMLLVANLGLFSSVVMATSRGASFLVIATLLTSMNFPWITRAVIAELLRDEPTHGPVATMFLASADWIEAALPWAVFQSAWSGEEVELVTFQVVANATAGLVLFGLAWLAFDRWNREDLAGGRGSLGVRLFGQRRSRRSPWTAPFVWKDFYFVTGGTRALVWKATMYLAAVALCLLLAVASGATIEQGSRVVFIISIIAVLFELALVASRVFSHEVRARTLPCLVQLPRSMHGLLYQKLTGCAVTLIPCLSFYTLAALANPDVVADLARNLAREPEVGYFLLALGTFFYHLVALLSLYLRWGAIAAATGITWVLIMMSAMVLRFAGRAAGEETVVVIGSTVALALAVGMHVGIYRRLLVVASH
ncbi:MAG: hypothetical protein AB7O52_07480 [Planctomycetota bacterium]